MVDYDFSGLPCTDSSRMKHNREFVQGPTGPVFLVWALRLRVYGVLLAVLENVPEPQPSDFSPSLRLSTGIGFNNGPALTTPRHGP